MRLDRYQRVLDQILSHPETWNQKQWHSECGTTHCFAGWAQVFSGKPLCTSTAESDAEEWLELLPGIGTYLFRGFRTLEDFHLYNGEDMLELEHRNMEWQRRPTSEGWWLTASLCEGGDLPVQTLVIPQLVQASDTAMWNREDRNRRMSPKLYNGAMNSEILWSGPIRVPPLPTFRKTEA